MHGTARFRAASMAAEKAMKNVPVQQQQQQRRARGPATWFGAQGDARNKQKQQAWLRGATSDSRLATKQISNPSLAHHWPAVADAEIENRMYRLIKAKLLWHI